MLLRLLQHSLESLVLLDVDDAEMPRANTTFSRGSMRSSDWIYLCLCLVACAPNLLYEITLPADIRCKPH